MFLGQINYKQMKQKTSDSCMSLNKTWQFLYLRQNKANVLSFLNDNQQKHLRCIARNPFFGASNSNQVQHKPGCTATEDD